MTKETNVDISKVTNVAAIKTFFGLEKTALKEMKALSSEERQELADMIRAFWTEYGYGTEHN